MLRCFDASIRCFDAHIVPTVLQTLSLLMDLGNLQERVRFSERTFGACVPWLKRTERDGEMMQV